MLQQMIELQDKARALGLDQVVASAQLAIEEVRAAEDALRASLDEADKAQNAGVTILMQDGDDQS